MKEISIFDIIGPNMIGPSSSHTAGALRIAQIASQICSLPFEKVTFVLYGSFAKTYRGHGTDRALLAGIMGFSTEDQRIKDAFTYADRAGLKYEFLPDESDNSYGPNSIGIIIKNTDGTTDKIVGSSIGGGSVSIDSINSMDVQFTGELNTILVRQKDTPGVVAHIGKCLAECGINIAFMRLYRENKGETAYTIVETDETINDDVLMLIKSHKNILSVKTVTM